ncbi:glycosyltransferase family 2 protein [Actinomycetospora sp. C-140]
MSVCVPLFQKAEYVGRTIDSVLAQNFTDFELVVIDNASTDGSGAVVDAYDDPRLRVVHHAETVPMIDNFHAAVAATRAPLVKVLMADDLIAPDALARQVAVLDAEPEVVVVSSRHHLIDDHDSVVARDRVLRTPDLVGRHDRGDVVRRVVRHGGNPLGCTGNMLMRRWAFDAVGGFPTEDGFTLDVGLAVRLTTVGDFYGLPETLASFRLAIGSVTSSARRHNLYLQREFIRRLRRQHADVIASKDVAQGLARWPLTWLRHRMIMSASSNPDSRVHRVSTFLLDPRRARRDDRHTSRHVTG